MSTQSIRTNPQALRSTVISTPVLSRLELATVLIVLELNCFRHCTGGAQEVNCDATIRPYNIPLRIGLLFVILFTSAIGVFLPILTTRFNLIGHNNILFVILKQFGTGIVIATAFVHLFTHADLMFGNECLGELAFEGTTAAIFMAGLFLSFLVDYLGARFVQWRQGKQLVASPEIVPVASDQESASKSAASVTPGHEFQRSHGLPHAHGPINMPSPTEEKINVYNLEAGIIFHSICKLSVYVNKTCG